MSDLDLIIVNRNAQRLNEQRVVIDTGGLINYTFNSYEIIPNCTIYAAKYKDVVKF